MLYHLPTVHRTCFRGEADTNLEQLTPVCQVWTGIALVFYLCQGFIRRAVQLELENVDIVRCFDDTIHPPFALLLFRVGGEQLTIRMSR